MPDTRDRDSHDALERRLDRLESKIDSYITQRQTEETQRLRTALVAIGGAVTVLSAFIWVEILWPAISSIRGTR